MGGQSLKTRPAIAAALMAVALLAGCRWNPDRAVQLRTTEPFCPGCDGTEYHNCNHFAEGWCSGYQTTHWVPLVPECGPGSPGYRYRDTADVTPEEAVPAERRDAPPELPEGVDDAELPPPSDEPETPPVRRPETTEPDLIPEPDRGERFPVQPGTPPKPEEPGEADLLPEPSGEPAPAPSGTAPEPETAPTGELLPPMEKPPTRQPESQPAPGSLEDLLGPPRSEPPATTPAPAPQPPDDGSDLPDLLPAPETKEPSEEETPADDPLKDLFPAPGGEAADASEPDAGEETNVLRFGPLNWRPPAVRRTSFSTTVVDSPEPSNSVNVSPKDAPTPWSLRSESSLRILPAESGAGGPRR